MKKKLILTIIISFLIGGIFSGFLAVNLLKGFELKLVNFLYSTRPASSEIVIVGIDEKTVSDKGLGRFQDFRRTYYAKVINNLDKAGVSLIGLDLLFSEKSKGVSEEDLRRFVETGEADVSAYLNEEAHPDDLVLASSIKKSGKVILGKVGGYESDNKEEIKTLLGEMSSMKIIAESAKGSGFVNSFTSNNEERVKKMPIGFINQESKKIEEIFAIKLVKEKLGLESEGRIIEGKYILGKKQIPLDKGEMWINFIGEAYSFPFLSFTDVYHNNFDKSQVENKIVLIGATDLGLKDNFPTPTTTDTLMPGVEIHANALQTILEDKYLVPNSLESRIVIIMLLAVITGIALIFLEIKIGILIVILELIIYLGIVQIAFNKGVILDIIYLPLTFLGVYLGETLYKYLTEVRQKKGLQEAFSKYVNPHIVEEILKNPEKLVLGGEKRKMTVLFSDIAGFTPISEKLPAEQVVTLLNEYLEEMTEVILSTGGTVDKYEGDAIMAFWGAPILSEDHAYKACLAATEMRKKLEQLDQKWKGEGKPLFNARIGINTGEMIVGNVGSKKHFNYTVIGDAVNLASRLEQKNKEVGSSIMISESTASYIQKLIPIKYLGEVEIKGKTGKNKVWGI